MDVCGAANWNDAISRCLCIPTKNPLKLLTQGSYFITSFFLSISRSSAKDKNAPYHEKKLSDEGSCSGRLASKYSRHARTALNSSGDVLSVAGSTIPENWAVVGEK